MNSQPETALESIKKLYKNMYTQHAETTNSDIKESKLKSGLMLLYFWAMAHNSEIIKNKLKEEAKSIFNSVGNFFIQVEIDYDNLLTERPDIIILLKDMNESDYDTLISFIQTNYLTEEK
ncbi:MAG: hypothetical protein HND52_00835 [Ignavibacteriae bacterium]|nr:hypothetical protein [Ignavibacteriota bacterium]NOG96493.1 hypothetical protein [Ignavibacteriota bacterium]